MHRHLQNIDSTKSQIRVFGTGTSSYQFLVHKIKEVLSAAGVGFEIHEINDVKNFIKDHVKSVPAVQVDNGEILYLHDEDAFNHSFRRIIQQVLKTYNYGSMPIYLLPVDFSDVSINAFYFGHRLATDLGAMVSVIHVYHPSSKDLDEGLKDPEEIIQIRQTSLDKLVNSVNTDWTSDIVKSAFVEGVVEQGFANEIILDSCSDENRQMIIMGATGQGGLTKKALGSVSLDVMNASECPVLIVPNGAKYKGINKIVLACDETETAEGILGELIDFGGKFNAEIHILHILRNEIKYDFASDFIHRIDRMMPEHKYKFVQKRYDSVEEGIISYCEENQIDLLAVPHKKKSILDRLLFESVTANLNIMSHIPFVVFKSPKDT